MEAVDLGQLIEELTIERDDALANLRLRDSQLRHCQRLLAEAREHIARISARAWDAETWRKANG